MSSVPTWTVSTYHHPYKAPVDQVHYEISCFEPGHQEPYWDILLKHPVYSVKTV
jgi:hypothetical protein